MVSKTNRFQFKHFALQLSEQVMKVSTDSILLGCWAKVDGAKNVLDIGTGSGILTLLLAQKCDAELYAIDISESAIKLADENFKNSRWSSRIRLFYSSIQKFELPVKFDVIISNPPYFQTSIVSPNQSRKIARHQLQLTFSELLLNTERLLSQNGKAFFCVPSSSVEEMVLSAEEQGLHVRETLQVRSTETKPPYLTLLQLQRHQSKHRAASSELIVFNAQGKYTQAFINLTQDAYSVNFF